MTPRLAAFRAKWRWYRDTGHVDLIRAQQGQAALVQQVRSDVLEACAEPPTRPYRVLLKMRAPRGERILGDPETLVTPAEVVAWQTADFGGRTSRPKAAACLTWLAREFGTTHV